MKTQILKAPDISCDHCERTIKQALGDVPGIAQVEVDIPRQEIQVEYDEQRVDQGAIEGILARAGYPVNPDRSVHSRKGGSSSCCAQGYNSMVPYLS
jgi:copper chaperone CopZ